MKKKIRFSSHPGAKFRCQGPLGPARAQLSWWYIILSSPTFHKDVNRLLKYVQCSYKNHQREDKCTNWISKLPLWLLNTTTEKHLGQCQELFMKNQLTLYLPTFLESKTTKRVLSQENHWGFHTEVQLIKEA